VFVGPAEELKVLAIALAALAAVAMSFGAQFQNDAVSERHKSKERGRGSLNLKQVASLLIRPRWLSGLGMMTLGIVLQLAALSLAPLIVVQPIGAIALIITPLLNVRKTKTKLDRATWLAIGLTTFGIGTFVAQATSVAHESVLTDDDLRTVLGLLGVLIVGFSIWFFTLGKRARALTFVLGAGVLYGFVATLAKVVIQRSYQGQFEWLTLFCLLALIGATALGGWFVQNAYASGPPDLVIAGLTVIDPMVAVSIAIIVLGEAKQASILVAGGFVFSALLAISGVFMLSKVHPELAPKPDSKGTAK
jgi:drug/metabolite transporter (DMT)-like permease